MQKVSLQIAIGRIEMEGKDISSVPKPGKFFKDHHGAVYISVTVKSFCRVRDYAGYPVFSANRMEWISMEQGWLDHLQELDL